MRGNIGLKEGWFLRKMRGDGMQCSPLVGDEDVDMAGEEMGSDETDETCATSELDDGPFTRQNGRAGNKIIGQDL